MAFSYKNSKGVTYYLHGRATQLKGGGTGKIYFFAKEIKAGALDAVPAGFMVSESKNGLPVLKKK
jgi:YHS domain-containing protein